MADNYLEKRYDEVFGSRKTVRKVGQTLDTLLLKNRSVRGYNKDIAVSEEVLKRIVSVNSKIASARNQQALRFHLVTKDNGAATVLRHIRMGGALPELHLPLPGTEPDAFIICCTSKPEDRYVDMDLGISMQSMLLKAVEIGFNGLIICAFNKQAVQTELSLEYEPLAIIAIGKSAERIELKEVSSVDSLKYYRENGVHYVPKIKLDDILF